MAHVIGLGHPVNEPFVFSYFPGSNLDSIGENDAACRWFNVLSEAESTPKPYRTAGRIKSTKNLRDPIGN